MADIQSATWSPTDSSNNSASPNGWTSGSMLPSQVEPTARAMMGAIRRWYDRANVTQSSTGSANAQVLTYNVAPAALVLGDIFSFKVGAGLTNTGAATLNVNALGAIAVQRNSAALKGGELQAGASVIVGYDGTNFQLIATSFPAAFAGGSFAPSNPAATNNTSPKMMGLGSTCTITPTATGKVSFRVSGVMYSDTAGDGVGVTLRRGTGAAPANGDAASGTVIGGNPSAIIAVGSDAVGFSIHGIVSGLAIGTAVWFDLAVNAITAGSAQVAGLSCEAVELP